MRSFEEMTAEVFRRIESQTAARKRKRRAIVKCTSAACCFCLIALIGIGAWRTASRDVPSLDASGGLAQISEESVQTSGGSVDESKKRIDVYYPARTNAGEFVIDMYRPEGYSEWVGSALALKMEFSEDETERFRVIVRPWNRSLEEVIAEVNSSLADSIDFTAFWTVHMVEVIDSDLVDPDQVIPHHNAPEYYGMLTAAQILALTTDQYRIRCLYVGSGEGSEENANWDTPEGMDVYCELLGDQMIVVGDHIECYPDIYAVNESSN